MGERHIVIVRREPTASPRFEWCEWEERPGRAPVDAGDRVRRWLSQRPTTGYDVFEQTTAAFRGRLPTER
jgi:hypothetical protein